MPGIRMILKSSKYLHYILFYKQKKLQKNQYYIIRESEQPLNKILLDTSEQ